MLDIQKPHLEMADLIFSISNFWHNRWTCTIKIVLPQDCIVSLACSCITLETFLWMPQQPHECHCLYPEVGWFKWQWITQVADMGVILCHSYPPLVMQHPVSGSTQSTLSLNYSFWAFITLVGSITNIPLWYFFHPFLNSLKHSIFFLNKEENRESRLFFFFFP